MPGSTASRASRPMGPSGDSSKARSVPLQFRHVTISSPSWRSFVDRLVGAVLVGVGGHELGVVGGAAEAVGLQDDLRAGAVHGLHQAEGRQGRDLRLPGLHGRHEGRVVARHEALDGDAERLGEVVGQGLDVLDEGACLARGHEADDELLGTSCARVGRRGQRRWRRAPRRARATVSGVETSVTSMSGPRARAGVVSGPPAARPARQPAVPPPIRTPVGLGPEELGSTRRPVRVASALPDTSPRRSPAAHRPEPRWPRAGGRRRGEDGQAAPPDDGHRQQHADRQQPALARARRRTMTRPRAAGAR